VTADVGVGPNDTGGFALDVELRVTLPGLSAEEAQQLVDAAHKVCPYSNATRNNVDVRVKVA
jgi:Ohr subfamily peroxiredoxin